MKRKVIIGSAAGAVIIAAAIVGTVAISNSPVSGTVEERYSAAEKLAEEGRLTKAANTYESIVKEDRKNVDAVIALSETYTEKNKYDDAIAELQYAIGVNPEERRLYDSLMSVYRKSGKILEGIQYVESLNDDELRREYMNKIYDRSSEAYIGTGNTMGNLANDGLAVFDDNAVYYSDLSQAKQLCKIENGEKVQLTDSEVNSLNIVGDCVYFIDKTNGSFICKIEKDGTGLKYVKKVRASDLIAVGDTLFFINLDEGNKVYSINADGSDMKKLSDRTADTLYAHGSQLFISDTASHSGTFRIQMDGKGEAGILADNVYFINGLDDMLFYRKDVEALNIWTSTKNGTGETKLNNVRSAYINTSGGYVFYVDFGDGGTLHRMRLDGSENVRISSDRASFLSVDRDYVYYFNKDNNKRLYRVRKDGSGRELVG